jgi:hypothetical protein
VTPDESPAPKGIEFVMLAGAWIAPLSFFIRSPGAYLPPTLAWTLVAVVVLATADRQRLVAAINWPVLAFSTMFAFIALSTLFATPSEYLFRGSVDIIVLSINILAFTVVRGYYATRPDAWLRFIRHLAASSVLMALGLTLRAISIGNSEQFVGVDSFALGLGTVAGAYTATFAAAAAVLIVFATTRRQLIAGIVAFIIHGNAMVLCLARGPWLAFAAAVITVVPLLAWKFGRQFNWKTTTLRALGTLVALPIFFRIAIEYNDFIRRLLVQRVVEVVKVDAGTGFSRLIMWQAILHDAGRSPVFGRGASAYREVSERLGVHGTVSENFPVEIMHSGGAVGITFLLLALTGVAYHCFLKPGAQRNPAVTAACLAGAAAVVVASMTNPAAWNGLFWIILGLAASRPVIARTVSGAS